MVSSPHRKKWIRLGKKAAGRDRLYLRSHRDLYLLFLDQDGAVDLGQFENRNLGLLHRAPLLVAAIDHAMGGAHSARGLLCAFYLRVREFVRRSCRGERRVLVHTLLLSRCRWS